MDGETPLTEVAIIAGDAMRRSGLPAVLTGGACAAVHCKGRYTSRDVDYILPLGTKRPDVERALTPLGYRWDTDCFVHADSRFFEVAVWIARAAVVDLETIREWSAREGHSASFEHFQQALEADEGS